MEASLLLNYLQAKASNEGAAGQSGHMQASTTYYNTYLRTDRFD